jgi:hypothetical protein
VATDGVGVVGAGAAEKEPVDADELEIELTNWCIVVGVLGSGAGTDPDIMP